jgi:ketosteroid isomerase-like protein
MTTQEVGNKLVELCKANKNMDAVEQLYSKDVESIEAFESPDPNMKRVTKGIDGIRKKHEWWYAETELHSGDVKGPFFHGDDHFSVFFALDVTMKSMKERMQMEEIAVYEVKGGKIVRERFFNSPMGM